MAKFRIVTALLLSFWSSVSSGQENPPSREPNAVAPRGPSRDEAACRPDVRRFCREVPDGAGQIAFLVCLKQNHARLTNACRDVLAGHGH